MKSSIKTEKIFFPEVLQSKFFINLNENFFEKVLTWRHGDHRSVQLKLKKEICFSSLQHKCQRHYRLWTNNEDYR